MSLKNTAKHASKKNCLIQVFGLGYVGFPLAVRLASSGFKVVGIDKDSQKIENLKKNQLLGSQVQLQAEFSDARKSGNLSISTESKKSDDTNIGIICVPTPSPDKKTDSNVYVNSAVAEFLEISKPGDVIFLESSIKVGTTDKIRQIIQTKGYKVGYDFGLSFCPERIDPLNQKWNLENIPRVIYCSDDTTFEIAQSIYKHINNSNLVRVSTSKVAEVVKSFENAFRLVNISLVNELAVLCDSLGISVKEVVDAAATKPFGFFPFYSGAGVGGHCIPKDPKFLLESSSEAGADFTTIRNALSINVMIPKYIAKSIEESMSKGSLGKSIIVCGLSYKPDIEDMRDSPAFKIITELEKRGFVIAVYDPFFKKELLDRYIIENNMNNFEYRVLLELSKEDLKKFNCLCIVQHHAKSDSRINEIYSNSEIPLIYDCQSKIMKNPNSKTVLHRFGS